jgi:IS5 family transposase
VSDSITWRQVLPDRHRSAGAYPTTLMKVTTRCGSTAVDGLNEALLAKAAQAKLLRCTRVRVDTTMVPANVAYPTDSGLLAKAVHRIAATGWRIEAAGGAVRTKVRDRSRAAGRRAHDFDANLRTRNAAAKVEALAVVHRKNAELADLA